jgi:hypothetical protein
MNELSYKNEHIQYIKRVQGLNSFIPDEMVWLVIFGIYHQDTLVETADQ